MRGARIDQHGTAPDPGCAIGGAYRDLRMAGKVLSLARLASSGCASMATMLPPGPALISGKQFARGAVQELVPRHAGASLNACWRRQAGDLLDFPGVEAAVIVERHPSALQQAVLARVL
jgi:hypothetical protein